MFLLPEIIGGQSQLLTFNGIRPAIGQLTFSPGKADTILIVPSAVVFTTIYRQPH